MFSVADTLSDAVRPFVDAARMMTDWSVPSVPMSAGAGAVTDTETNCGGEAPMMLAAFGLRNELSCAT